MSLVYKVFHPEYLQDIVDVMKPARLKRPVGVSCWGLGAEGGVWLTDLALTRFVPLISPL